MNLAAGGEQAAALATALDTNITLSAGSAETIWNTITVTTGDVTHDLGGGQGSLLHKGTITLDGTTTLAQAYQAMQWACSENSTAMVAGVPGYRYRGLNSGYSENQTAPFGTTAGGKWFVAQGWWLAGVMPSDSKNYQLIAHDGTVETPPTSVSVSIGGVVSGDYVLAVRDDGAGGLLESEYTVSAVEGATSITVSGIKTDTPSSGVIRVGVNRHTYSAISGGAVTGLSPVVPTGGYSSASAFIPFIDGTAADVSIASDVFQYVADLMVHYRVRHGSSPSIVPFESTLQVTSNGGSATAVRNADE